VARSHLPNNSMITAKSYIIAINHAATHAQAPFIIASFGLVTGPYAGVPACDATEMGLCTEGVGSYLMLAMLLVAWIRLISGAMLCNN